MAKREINPNQLTTEQATHEALRSYLNKSQERRRYLLRKLIEEMECLERTELKEYNLDPSSFLPSFSDDEERRYYLNHGKFEDHPECFEGSLTRPETFLKYMASKYQENVNSKNNNQKGTE